MTAKVVCFLLAPLSRFDYSVERCWVILESIDIELQLARSPLGASADFESEPRHRAWGPMMGGWTHGVGDRITDGYRSESLYIDESMRDDSRQSESPRVWGRCTSG